MELCVKLVTTPWIAARIAILVIIVIATIVLWRGGFGLPETITVAIGASVAYAGVSRSPSVGMPSLEN